MIFYTEKEGCKKKPFYANYAGSTTKGDTKGLGIGIGPNVGFMTGTLENFEGKADNTTWNIVLLSITYTENENGAWGLNGSFGGKGLGIGKYKYETETVLFGGENEDCECF